jgi:hypothetical protein
VEHRFRAALPIYNCFTAPPTISIPSGFTLALVEAMPLRSAKGEKKMSQQLRNAVHVLSFRALLGLLIVGFGLFAVGTRSALASTTITGTVGPSGKYLVTGAPVTAATSTVLKLSFENKTPGTNLELCAGTAADFAAGTCSLRLSDSGGPGFVFLTITDTAQLSGKVIFVLRVVGITASTFTLTVE